MSDENAPDAAEAVEDSAPEAPATPDTPIDWEKRAGDNQAAYTRAQQVLSDRDALLAHVAEKFPDLLAEDDEQEEDDDEFETEGVDPEVAELKAWKQEVEAERANERFTRDLKDEAGDREVPGQGRDWILQRTLNTGDTRDALNKAVKEWFEFEDSLRQPADPQPTPRAAHVMRGGKAATGVPNYSEMTRAEANRVMTERARALEQT